MADKRDLPICKACRWYDKDNAQCFDGHLQYEGKIKCDGFENFTGKDPLYYLFVHECANVVLEEIFKPFM